MIGKDLSSKISLYTTFIQGQQPILINFAMRSIQSPLTYLNLCGQVRKSAFTLNKGVFSQNKDKAINVWVKFLRAKVEDSELDSLDYHHCPKLVNMHLLIVGIA